MPTQANATAAGPLTTTDSELVVPGTVLDLAQTVLGQFFYYFKETGGANAVNVYLQFSNDSNTWVQGVDTDFLVSLLPSHHGTIQNAIIAAGSVETLRFTQLSVKSSVNGSPGVFQFVGSFSR